jgi:hypothetical protein
MALTDRLDILGGYVYNLLLDNKVALGLADVWYGDQNITPTTPCAVVETGPKRRAYNGAPRRYGIAIDIYIILYLEKIQDQQLNRKQSETLAEDVEALLHQDWTMGGLVIESYVATSEPAYATRGRSLVSATRLTLTATSEKMLPSQYNPNP